MSSRTYWLRAGLVVMAVLVIGGALILANRGPEPVSLNLPTQEMMTLPPQVIANLTNMPQATPLSGAAADQVNALRQKVADCPDYSAERRAQMNQHIDWLLNPAGIPRDVLLALGENVSGRLIFGMATYTSIEWRLKNKPAASCLLSIGKTLNDMLTAYGEKPLPEFQ
jgi:hypothetical protein